MTSRQHMIFDLEAGLFKGGDWFTAQLFRLIAKADSDNVKKLEEGFPVEVQLFHEFKREGGSLFLEIHPQEVFA
jgi:hypothetical protein|tara:strand:+ start:284 stop:505 length:222 start_codon:yes stop_codon:yes gene_type:complete